MRTIRLIGLGAAVVGALGACSGSGDKTTSHSGSQPGGGNADGGGSSPSDSDGGNTTVPSDTGTSGAPKRLLVTFTGSMSSEVVALDMESHQVDGRLGFPGFGVTSGNSNGSLFLLEQNTDVIASLEANKPWDTTSLWSMAMPDALDGGSWYSQPMQVIATSAQQSYALRYERNDIALFDQSANGDAGVPSMTVDLASLVQSGDADGVVEMTWGVYIPSMSRIYLVLQNINQVLEAQYGNVVCAGLVSTVTAIDTATNQIVNLGGTGPKGSIALTYYNPLTAVYDAANDRILVVGAGCSAKASGGGDGGLGAASMRGVEAVSLTTNKTTSLLDLDKATFPMGFVDLPTSFAYLDATHAAIGFDQTGQAVFFWNPTETTIGNVIPNAPDVFISDGNGALLGTRTTGATTAIVDVAVPHGESTTLATNITSLTGATYTSSLELWPAP